MHEKRLHKKILQTKLNLMNISEKKFFLAALCWTITTNIIYKTFQSMWPPLQQQPPSVMTNLEIKYVKYVSCVSVCSCTKICSSVYLFFLGTVGEQVCIFSLLICIVIWNKRSHFHLCLLISLLLHWFLSKITQPHGFKWHNTWEIPLTFWWFRQKSRSMNFKKTVGPWWTYILRAPV